MQFITEKERKTPLMGEADVLVAGGGFAGISAALAAARQGKRVLLCEREFALGGLGTLGLVSIYLPLCDGSGRQVSFGIAEELFHLSLLHGVDDHKHPRPTPWLDGGTLEEKMKIRFQAQYYPWFFVSDVECLLEKEGVRILYGTAVSDVIVEDGRIVAVILENVGGRSAVSVRSVVDATGNASVATLSGEETALYPAGNVPSSWYYYASRGKVALKMFGPKDYQGAGLDPALQGVSFSGLDPEENSKMLIFARKKMVEDLEEMRRQKEDPNLFPVAIPAIQELRMTRRIVGKGSFSYDSKEKRCETSVGCIGNWHKVGGGYEIPYESLFGCRVKNLITAGRCISADDAGWDLTRVIPACAVTGEAAGVAAALTDDFAGLSVSLLQEKLGVAGVRIHLND